MDLLDLLVWMRCYEIWFRSSVGSNGYRRTVGLDDLVGPFRPCDSMTFSVTWDMLEAIPEDKINSFM